MIRAIGLTLIGLLIFCNTSTANGKKEKEPFVQQIGFGIGANVDRYKALDRFYMEDFIKQTSLQNIDLPYSNTLYFPTVSGGFLTMDLVLRPLQKVVKFGSLNTVWITGVDVHFAREAMVEFNQGTVDEDRIIYCIIQNEIALNNRLMVTSNPERRIFLSGGLGFKIGSTFNNEFIIINESPYDLEGTSPNDYGETRTPASASMFYRVFVPVAISWNISPQVVIYFENRFGIGHEIVMNKASYFINGNYTAFLGLAYQI
jgi:hypothetical protein